VSMAKADSALRKQRCIEIADEPDTLLFADGYDAAIVGIGIHGGIESVAYDAAKVIAILRRRDGMSQEEAEEFFEFNVLGAWVGERTPMFVRLAR
jgi:hypothetical protein